MKATSENSEQRYDNELKAYETSGAVDKALGITNGCQNPVDGVKASMESYCLSLIHI